MRRSKIEMYMDILGALENGEKKISRIMYSSIVNMTVAKKYLEVAMQREHVTKNEEKRNTYAITNRGLEFLSGWKEYKELSEKLEMALGDKADKK
jgi:predicted transcriptional regulator